MQTSSSITGSMVDSVRLRTGARLSMSAASVRNASRERLLFLQALCSPQFAEDLLQGVLSAVWQREARWLDTSGLTLYLYETLCAQGLEERIPSELRARWSQNLRDNTGRMHALVKEACTIHRLFQSNRICYATLKGFSLYPHSVPKPELRSQLDLDFKVDAQDAGLASRLLREQGYTLRAFSGRSMEFKKNESASMTLNDLYKPLPFRCVELHLEDAASSQSVLRRVVWQPFHGTSMPVLHPVDLFLGQGMHLFKHICSEFFRVAHMLEFRRHIEARYHESEFWREVMAAARSNERVAMGLGIAIALTERVTGTFAPSSLLVWTADALPDRIRLWIEEYGAQITLCSFPGSKLYLLLQQELEAHHLTAKRSVQASLLPLRLPPAIVQATPDEDMRSRLRRHLRQASFLLFRARFHLREALRFAWESRRWKRLARNFTIAAFLLFSISMAAQTANTIAPSLPLNPGQTVTGDADTALPLQRIDTLAQDPSDALLPVMPRTDGPLTVGQITQILAEHPDAIIEAKQLMSDQSAQAGNPVSADTITDPDFYRAIASNPTLRTNLTVFFQARGYLPEADPSQDDVQAYSQSLQSLQRGSQQPPSTSQNISSSVRRGRPAEKREQPNGPAVLHQPTPYNLLSLRDLYTQVTEEGAPLKRFGADIFTRRDTAAGQPMSVSAALDVAAPSSYVLGPGDVLAVQLWGGISQTLSRTIDREGFVALPEAGPVQVAGLTLERATASMQNALRQQYRNIDVAVTLSRLRSIRVYVIGDVQRPGAYPISALATPINALYAAGGPTSVGSLRILRHYRGNRLVGEIDLYDFLLHGVQAEEHMEAGDTLLVPPAGPQVAVSGAVKRPAIYELKGDTTLAALLDDAGAVTVSAELAHITIDRIRANQQRETIDTGVTPGNTLQQQRAALAGFRVQDGDRVRISPIEAYSQRVVYAEGHVLRPGRIAYHDGMTLSDVLRSYRDLLPEPADRGEIVRLVPPDLHVETVEFSVSDLLLGSGNLALQPLDTVRVFGRYESDAPKVTIDGEVLHPGSFPLSQGMTAAQLVRLAGGFTRAALLADADLTSYHVVQGTRVEGERISVPIGDAVGHDHSAADVPLKAGDVLTVHKLTGWDDIGASIVLEGEVAHPGRYGFQQGERLSSVLRRAGGFRSTSYPAGAVLIREDVKALEEKSREELIRQIETSSSSARLASTITPGDGAAQLQLVQAQQEQILASLKKQPAVGRLVLHIGPDIASWENTSADIEVRAGDTLRIPKRPGFVLVSGQVYNSSAITYTPGKSAGWYLQRAGGPTEVANTREIFVIRANGSVVGRDASSFFHRDVLATRLDPGDVVVVPQKIIGSSLFWRNLLTVAQITSSIAITAAVAGVL